MTGTDANSATITRTTTTAADGSYKFIGMTSGTYTLVETQPVNYQDGKETAGTSLGTVDNGSFTSNAAQNSISAITLPPATAATGYLFGDRAGSIAGTVYHDKDDSGTNNAGDVGIAGVTITLSGTTASGVSVCTLIPTCTFTTASDGTFSLTGLPASGVGGYTLTETQPVDYANRTSAAGTGGGTAGDTTITGITVAAGANVTNYLFGEKTNTISGFVYLDANNDGVKDPGETGVGGVTVTLSGMTASNVDVCTTTTCTATTASDGSYSFIYVRNANGSGYTVTETQPVNYLDGKETAGTQGGTAANAGYDATAANNRITTIPFSAVSPATGYNFGERTGSITGTVYYDADHNGSMNGADTGLAGVTITLSGTTAGGENVCTVIAAAYPTCSVTTASDGTFSFIGLPASGVGGYTLTESQPVDYADRTTTAGTAGGSVTGTTISTIVLGVGVTSSGNLFGEKTGAISGFVYHDANDNGVKDGGEAAIAGVTMTLSGLTASGANVCTTIPSCTTTTDVNGAYSFSGLRNTNGSGYTITESQPAGYLDGKETAGTQGGTVDNTGFDSTAAKNRISAIPFSAAAAATGYNFGDVISTGLSGKVYHDANNNTTYEAGEELAGVTITLTGKDDQGSDINLTTTTATDGTYSFINLRPSNATGYILTETQPLGVSDFSDVTGTQRGTIGGVTTGTAALNQVTGIVLASSQSGINYNFREDASSLAGFVYIDDNNNGAKDTAEYPIPGVTITLTGTDANSATITRTTTTAADGSYKFIGMTSGTYTLTETQPVNYQDGKETAGTSLGTVDNGSFTSNPAQNSISAITLPPATAATGYLFGDRAGSISGTVYYDANDNGSKEPAETGIAGVIITLSGLTASGVSVCTLIPTCTFTTAANGTFTLNGLPASGAGGYTLTETQPVDYADRTTAAGTGGGAVTGTTVTGITLGVGGNAANYLFGEKTGAISGKVYHDVNNNGISDDGPATGIAGVTLTLSGLTASGADICTPPTASCTTTTVLDGTYTFTGLRNASAVVAGVGGYTITETQATDYLDGKETAGTQGGIVDNTSYDATPAKNSITAIPFSATAAATDYNFGEISVTSVAGRVYHDAKPPNAIYDTGEQLAGVTLRLTGTDDQGLTVNLTTTTAADGTYSFTNLRPTDSAGYTVTETQPTGIINFPGTAGTQVGTVNGSSVGAIAAVDQISGIVLGSAQHGINYNFREDASSISGLVYNDVNENGSREPGEPGIAGVIITLTGTDANGSPVNRTTTTAADGTYSFLGLTSGTYTVTETQPVIYVDGTTTAGTAGGNATTPNVISTVTIGPGAAATGYVFSEKKGLPGGFSGTVWFNTITRDQTKQTGEPGLAGWIVQVKRAADVTGPAVDRTTTTAADGTWSMTGLDAAAGYEIIFHHPTNNVIYGDPVQQDSSYPSTNPQPTYANHTIDNMTLASGGNVTKQNLPVDPSGVVYDSITRLPVSGATVAISGPAGFDAATHLAGGTTGQSQTTTADGFYQFLLLTGAPAGIYTLAITTPPGYVPGTSTIIPPTSGPFNPGTGTSKVAIQVQPTAPTGAAPTIYYMTFTMSGASNSVVNNHIPVDPILGGAIRITKVTPIVNVSVGEMVPYTIEATNTLAATIPNIDLVDQVPPGFKYRSGSARLNGVAVEPLASGRSLRWPNLTFAPAEKKTLKLLLVVGAGVTEGNYTNQAWCLNNIVNAQVSNIAEATVRVVPDPTFDCTDIIGKVFDDRNANGYQDDGEPGIPNVRVVTARGWLITTDADGRFHVACAAIPQADRGSNFIMKLDERTLPSGFRVTTENPRVVRATRGKMIKLNFGATIHRVVRVEVSDSAFSGDGTKLQPDWSKRFDDLPNQLREKPSVVRLAYRIENGNRRLAQERMDNMTDLLRKRWEALNCCYPLSIEQEMVEVKR